MLFQVHGTGPWLFHLAMSAAGYEDLLRLSTLQKQRGAAEKGSGLALADPHTHQTECLNCTHRPTKEDRKKGVSFWQPPPPRIEYLFEGSKKQPGVVVCTRLAHLSCLAKTLTLTHLQALEMAVLYLFW